MLRYLRSVRHRGVVKRFNIGLQNRRRGFDSFRPCSCNTSELIYGFGCVTYNPVLERTQMSSFFIYINKKLRIIYSEVFLCNRIPFLAFIISLSVLLSFSFTLFHVNLYLCYFCFLRFPIIISACYYCFAFINYLLYPRLNVLLLQAR